MDEAPGEGLTDEEVLTWVLEHPGWHHYPTHLTWAQVVMEHASRAHAQGHVARCADLCLMVAADAADHGSEDRLALAFDRDELDFDWSPQGSSEFARRQGLSHLLAEHSLSVVQVLDLAPLYIEAIGASAPSISFIRDLLDDNARWLKTFRAFTVIPATTTDPSLDDEINEVHAWAVVHWLLADAVPAVLRFAGMDDTADDFACVVPDNLRFEDDARAKLWLNFPRWEVEGKRLMSPADLPWFVNDRSRDKHRATTETFVRLVLESAGLGPHDSPLRTVRATGAVGFVEDVGMDNWRWRPLRGTWAWIAMYEAALSGGSGKAWARTWDRAGTLLASVLGTAVNSLALQMDVPFPDTDPRYSQDALSARWRVLCDAFELAYREFIQALPRLGESA